MSWTSHDKILGWIHGFKINKNNTMLKPDAATLPPFPAIIESPSIKQVLNNWNRSDTGVVLAMFVAGLFIASRGVRKNALIEGYFDRRYEYYRYVNLFTFTGLFLGARNSYYRLAGLVPNGLPRTEEDELVKYDYTTDILRDTFWGSIFEPQRK